MQSIAIVTWYHELIHVKPERHTVHIGLSIPQLGPHARRDSVVEVSQRAEKAGFHSLWVLDRLLVPTQPQEPYPASPDGKLPAIYERVLDPIMTLSLVAAVTERVRIGSSILVMPLYNPVVLGRMTASLDVLSGGRLTLGLGIGWSSDEFDVIRGSISNRGDFADEYLDILRKVWTEQTISHNGSHFSIPESTIGLSPAQQPHPPVLLAAYTDSGLRRVAERADGWLAAGIPLDAVNAMFGSAQQHASDKGRDPKELQLVVRANLDIHDSPIDGERSEFTGSIEKISADVDHAAAIGVDELIIELQFSRSVSTPEHLNDHVEAVIQMVKQHLI